MKMWRQQGDFNLIQASNGARPKTNIGTFENRYSALDSDNDTWQVQERGKRRRRDTGGSYGLSRTQTGVRTSTNFNLMSKSEFKELSTDDKLVTMFELMSDIGSLHNHINKIETHVQTLHSTNMVQNDRIKVIEYKTIDMEARNRRNNLVFRGHPENLEDDNCIGIIRRFISEKLGLSPINICIQRAHRLGNLNQRRNRGGRQNPGIRPRPIIVNFRDYSDVELILENAYKLKGTPFGINKDYPREILNARVQIWPQYKKAREQNPNTSVYIGYPAKLIVKGRVVVDKFPDWKNIISKSRIHEQSDTDYNITYNEPLNLNSAMGFTQEIAEKEHESNDSDDVVSMQSARSRSRSISPEKLNTKELKEPITVDTQVGLEAADSREKSNTEPSAVRSEPNTVVTSKPNRARSCQKETSTSQKDKKQLRSTDSQNTQESKGPLTYDEEMKRLLDGVEKVRQNRAKQPVRSSSETRPRKRDSEINLSQNAPSQQP